MSDELDMRLEDFAVSTDWTPGFYPEWDGPAGNERLRDARHARGLDGRPASPCGARAILACAHAHRAWARRFAPHTIREEAA